MTNQVIKIKTGQDLPMSAYTLRGQLFEVISTSEFQFVSGIKKYYHIVVEKVEIEIREDFVETVYSSIS